MLNLLSRRSVAAAALGVSVGAAFATGSLAAGEPIRVFAASTLIAALDALADTFRTATGTEIHVTYGPSSVLEQMLERGVAADLFIPASSHWMTRAQAAHVIRGATRIDLLTSHLVLFAKRGNGSEHALVGDGIRLSSALASHGRLAICDPELIDSGAYARASLEAMDQWKAVEGSLSIVNTERMLRAIVENGQAILGIGFDTDVVSDPRLEIVGVLPDGSHPPIVYPAALTQSASVWAREFLAYLHGREAAVVFSRLGYGMSEAAS